MVCRAAGVENPPGRPAFFVTRAVPTNYAGSFVSCR